MPGQTHAHASQTPVAYSFTSDWTHPADPGVVFDVLADLGGYPDWWPQVRAVARLDDDTARVVCRSVLPYHLDLELVRVEQDRDSGVLAADIAGDLAGWSRWTLTEDPRGTRLDYEQQVIVTSPLLALASRAIRPVLVANHTWMMRGGRRGLLRHAPGQAGGVAR